MRTIKAWLIMAKGVKYKDYIKLLKKKESDDNNHTEWIIYLAFSLYPFVMTLSPVGILSNLFIILSHSFVDGC